MHEIVAGLLGCSIFLTAVVIVLFWLDIRYIQSPRFHYERSLGITTIYPWLMWLRWAIFGWVATGISLIWFTFT